MGTIPDNIKQYFKFFADEKTGDYEQYHVYCYCNDGLQAMKFCRTWKITGTDLAIAQDKETLRQQRKETETENFEKQIREELERHSKRLVLQGGDLNAICAHLYTNE